MQKLFFIVSVFSQICLVSCNNQGSKTSSEEQPIVFRFELDSSGAISSQKIKKQLADLALKISANADRVVMHSFTEKMNTEQESVDTAYALAAAAKEIMFHSATERIYYSVGIDALGFKNPIDAAHPNSRLNRRIEIEYLK